MIFIAKHTLNMISFLFLIPVATAVSPSDISMLIPSFVGPKKFATTDGWACYTPNYADLLNMPKPTGELSKALLSYGDELLKTCTLAGDEKRFCPFPDSTLWCAFPTAAPTAVLPAYTSYGSSASSFWSEKSSSMLSLASNCPERWYDAIYVNISAPWINNTIAQAECYAKAHTTSGISNTVFATASATVRAAASGNTPAVTSMPNGVLDRGQNIDWWIVGGSALAAAVNGAG
ncbi:hypothetical protein BT63DRAFT_449037 [Microthyrium microscopicum]|uniref:DUF7735 domain-containing protein n=1 Tax=Microthyrium microscopicum TaxID=703497 RepID=A0A6A6USI8_9PEZI|nr:hypothetical protein BT63DRAFT_449037 [Microthyrium microscopicum]